MNVLLLIMLLISSTSYAEDILVFKNGMKFNHTMHQTEKVGICSACHDQEPAGKITGFGKEWSHINCIECHDVFKEGPTDCKGCHKGGEFKAK